MAILELKSDYERERFWGITMDFQYFDKTFKSGEVLSATQLESLGLTMATFLIANDYIFPLPEELVEEAFDSMYAESKFPNCKITELKTKKTRKRKKE